VTGAEGKIDPAQVSDHLKLLSYDLINDDPTDPVLWPGADIFHMVDHLYLNGSWGTDNDVFLIDMPAGAGDVPINLFTAFPVDGTVIVGEPSELAVAPLQRCVAMTRMFLSAPVAYVENKSLDGGAHLAPRLDLGAKCVNFALPLSPELAAHDGEVTPAMAELADELAEYVVSLIPQK
jgi:Mrp family chromosome partitioning ATPase